MEAEFKQQKTKRERDSLEVQLNEIKVKLGQHQELVEVMSAEIENFKAMKINARG